MSREADQPRQRTVAELLAENGGTGPTGGRRRRREADGPPVAPRLAERPVGAGTRPTPLDPHPSNPGRLGPLGSPPSRIGADPAYGRRPNGHPGDGHPPNGHGGNGHPPNGHPPNGHPPNGPARPGGPSTPGRGYPHATAGGPPGRLAAPPPPAEPRTEQLPRVHEARRQAAPLPVGYGPPDRHPAARRPAGSDGGPPTMLGARPLAGEDTDDDGDGGPPTVLGAPPLADDRYADDRYTDDEADGEYAAHPVGLDTDDPASDESPLDLDLDEDEDEGPGWLAVIAQWIGGALVGAALWVGFRYLWLNLPVLALAAAVLITVGLVLGVRALLRNDDLRTTIFAVLVGLLLTVSPAILVLLGR